MYRISDISGGGGAGTAVLSLDCALSTLPRTFGRRAAPPPPPSKGFSLVVDLGTGVGSLEWWRGLLTCTALCWSAWSLATAPQPLPGPAPAPMGEAEWEEAQAFAIAPLAYGAGTGRRMIATQAAQPLLSAPERPKIDLSITMAEGDSFAAALERAGVGTAEAAEAATLIAGAIEPAQVKPGTTIAITLGTRPAPQAARPLEALAFRARLDLRLEIRRSGGGLALTRIPIAVDETPLRIQGNVGASLYFSARAAGAPARVVEAYIRVLAAQTSIGSLTAEDRFDIVLEHRRAATGETESGGLLYAGLYRHAGKDLQLMPWNAGGGVQWFEASGVGETRSALERPVPGPVTSGFGGRLHPILRYLRMHNGIDFAAPHGTPIIAATDGQVIGAGWAGGYGRQVRLAHAGGLSTSYSHMSAFTVAPGMLVRRGQVIGYVGSSGLSTGPHLHYELHRNGVAINPASVTFISRSLLSGAQLEGFRHRLARLLALPVGAATPPEASRAAP